MKELALIMAVVLNVLPCSAQNRVPSFTEVVDFRADPITSAPSRHFKDFRVTREDLQTILETYRVVPKDRWERDYHHVAFGDRTGTITLLDRTVIHWFVRPGGLASLTFPDQTRIYLAAAACLSEVEVRKLATQYRDQWVAANQPEGASWLAQGRIVSVQQSPNGWHVVFATKTGDDPRTPEGLHIYYLHIYLKASGELDKIVRGPDVLS
jgi:hypothetical protein